MVDAMRSANILVNSVLSDPKQVQDLQTDPGTVLRAAAQQAIQQAPPLQSDVWVYRLVVAFLGATAVIVVIGSIVFSIVKTGDVPSGIIGLGSAAVGALAGLLAPSPVGRS